jgi:hypothetical protein
MSVAKTFNHGTSKRSRRIIIRKKCSLSPCVTFQVLALKMEAASTSETSLNFYQATRRNNPEDSHLQVCVSQADYSTKLNNRQLYNSKCNKAKLFPNGRIISSAPLR